MISIVLHSDMEYHIGPQKQPESQGKVVYGEIDQFRDYEMVSYEYQHEFQLRLCLTFFGLVFVFLVK